MILQTRDGSMIKVVLNYPNTAILINIHNSWWGDQARIVLDEDSTKKVIKELRKQLRLLKRKNYA